MRRSALIQAGTLLAGLLCAGVVRAGEIVFPKTVTRERSVRGAYVLAAPATGAGTLLLRWSDTYGRTVEEHRIPVALHAQRRIPFVLDMRRAVALANRIDGRLTLRSGAQATSRTDTAHADFIASPPAEPWWDYHIIMWQPHPADIFADLKTIGIDGGIQNGKSRTPPANLLANDLRWYAENIATDFYSQYHRYFPDHEHNWKMQEVRRLYRENRANPAAFRRDPSLADPQWIETVRRRVADSVRFWAPYRPFFYSLGDETGVADLASFWDFDFSEPSLAGMRTWLRERYGTLQALNREWDTTFRDWSAVRPPTTDEAMQRGGDNFSAWSDFKEWMDVSFARALQSGADAAHSVDPDALVGIGGAQMPGWGGYDYYRLTRVLNLFEPYDIGRNVTLIHSLNPQAVILTTSFQGGAFEKYRVWYELLEGSRGLILWDDKMEYARKDGVRPPRGREAAPYYAELRNGLGALIAAGERQADAIAIHYSQPSMRVEWMLEQRPHGRAWTSRGSSAEYTDSRFLRLRMSWTRAIEDLGLGYRFIADPQVAAGELRRGGYRVLVLPASSALSAAETAEIRAFVAEGGTVLASGIPGTFDEHGRRLPKSSLAEVFAGPRYGKGRAILLPLAIDRYQEDRLAGREQAAHSLLARLLRESGVAPEFAVTDASGNPVVGVECHRFQNGGVTLVGLLPNAELRITELGPPQRVSNQRFEQPRAVRLTAPRPLYAWDLRTGNPLGKVRSLDLRVDPYEPTLIAFSSEPMPVLKAAAPSAVRRGGSARLDIGFAAPTPARTHILHVDVAGPGGKPFPCYSGNLRAPGGKAVRYFRPALSDPAGEWHFRIRDVLTSQEKTIAISVP